MARVAQAKNLITKFNGKDYVLWKYLIKIILHSEGLYEVAFDEDLFPITNDEKQAYTTANTLSKNIILSYLDPKHIKLTEDCYLSREIIKKLDKIYGEKTSFEIMLAEENFYSYKMGSRDKMADHLAKVEELAQKIRDAGGKICNCMIMCRILGSLCRKYHKVRETWLTPSKEDDTLEDLKDGLLWEEGLMFERKRLGLSHPTRHHHHHRKPYRSHHHRPVREFCNVKSHRSLPKPKN